MPIGPMGRRPPERCGRTSPDNTGPPKSPDAFRTIGEVSKELGVPQHVLRFWETKFPQIKPLKRSGGRRYYRPEDVALLRHIQHLLHAEGYTVKGVQKLLRERAAKASAAPDAPAAAEAATCPLDPGKPRPRHPHPRRAPHPPRPAPRPRAGVTN